MDKDLVGTDVDVLEKLYFNNADKKYVSETSVTVDKETYSGLIFVDKEGIAVNSEDILGSDKTLLLDISNFVDNFEESALVGMILETIDVDTEMMGTIVDALEEVEKMYDKVFSGEYEEEYKEQLKAYTAILDETVSSETVEGKTYSVVTYTINNNAIKSILKAALDQYDLPKEIMDEMEEAIDETIVSLNDSAVINIVFKIYIDNSLNKVEKVVLDGTVTPIAYPDEIVEFNAAVVFAANEIKFNFEGSTDDEEIVADATLTRNTDGDKNVYSLVVNAGDNKGGSVNALNATITHDKKTCALVIAADVYNNGDDRIEFEVIGSLAVDGDKATLAFDSATAMGKTVEFKLEFVFEKSATIPEMPSDTTDISTMTEEDIQQLMQDIQQKSKLAQLFNQ